MKSTTARRPQKLSRSKRCRRLNLWGEKLERKGSEARVRKQRSDNLMFAALGVGEREPVSFVENLDSAFGGIRRDGQ